MNSCKHCIVQLQNSVLEISSAKMIQSVTQSYFFSIQMKFHTIMMTMNYTEYRWVNNHQLKIWYWIRWQNITISRTCYVKKYIVWPFSLWTAYRTGAQYALYPMIWWIYHFSSKLQVQKVSFSPFCFLQYNWNLRIKILQQTSYNRK